MLEEDPYYKERAPKYFSAAKAVYFGLKEVTGLAGGTVKLFA